MLTAAGSAATPQQMSAVGGVDSQPVFPDMIDDTEQRAKRTRLNDDMKEMREIMTKMMQQSMETSLAVRALTEVIAGQRGVAPTAVTDVAAAVAPPSALASAPAVGTNNAPIVVSIHKEENVEGKVPEEVRNHVDNVVKKHTKAIQKYIKTKERKEALDKDLEYMRESGFKYPPGTRPFKSQVELNELDDEVLPDALEDDWVFSVKIAKSTRYRDAMLQIHHATAAFIKACYAEAYAQREKAVLKETRKDAFFQSCAEFQFEHAAWEKLGLDDPVRKVQNQRLVQRYTEDAYQQMVDKVRSDADKIKKQKEMRDQSEKKKAEELASAQPKQLITEVFAHFARREVAKGLAAAKADVRPDEPMDGEEQAGGDPEAESDEAVGQEAVTKLVNTMVHHSKRSQTKTKPKQDSVHKKGSEKAKGKSKGKAKGEGKGNGAEKGWRAWQARTNGSSKGSGSYQDSGKNNAHWSKNWSTPPAAAGGKGKGKGKEKATPGRKGVR